jgi:RNA polymerase sigma-70 factor, ECF subfamily
MNGEAESFRRDPPAGGPPEGDAGEAAGSFDPAALARRDPAAVEAFYRELCAPIYAFVYWRVGGDREDAEDVTQETFLTALATADRFQGRSSFYSWMCGIARNLAHARVRGRRRGDRPAEATAAAAGGGGSPDLLYERAETDHLVGCALTELPPHYQRALLDKYVDRRSFAEMAAAGQCSPKAIESTVQRAKRALAEALGRLGLRRSQGGSHE